MSKTHGHCPNLKHVGGCGLHNVHCNYPDCDVREDAATPPAPDAGREARDDEDADRCIRCGHSDSCCVTAIGSVGHGVPLGSIGVGEDAETLYNGKCVRELLDRALAASTDAEK